MFVLEALGSFTFPALGATTVSVSTRTRMASYFSSCSMEPPGSVSAAVIVTGAGSGLPLENTVTPDWVISVFGGLLTSAPGMNSVTVPVVSTNWPAVTVGVAPVKTIRPSEVSGSLSSAASPSGVWMKYVFEVRPVTMPRARTSCPFSGDPLPLPWMTLIGYSGAVGGGAEQSVGVEDVLRGATGSVVKSAALLSFSVHPLVRRRVDRLDGPTGAGPAPSKQSALPP